MSQNTNISTIVYKDKTVLIIGAGNVDINHIKSKFLNCFIVCVDRGYNVEYQPSILQNSFYTFANNTIPKSEMFPAASAHQNVINFISSSIFDFMYGWPFKFDVVIGERIFEHMFYDSGEVGQLLNACNQITTEKGILEIVVPDANKLIHIVKNTELTNSNVLLINTEFCNSRTDPHGSVWTQGLARLYIANEGEIWKIVDIQENYKFMGRDIYMKIKCSKYES